MSRPEINNYFFNLAMNVAKRSTCLRNQVGAVIVKDKQILSTGYNGAASGLKHCSDEGNCIRVKKGAEPGEHYEWCVAIHAELNSILQAAKHGIEIKGATIYSTEIPCAMCARAIVNVGIKEVFAINTGRINDYEAGSIFTSAGVRFRPIVQDDLK